MPKKKTSSSGKVKKEKAPKEKPPEFHTGKFEFIFPNRDKYIGDFSAHRSGLAWREGPGTYITHDGQTYKGTWKDDKIDENANLAILFQDKDKFFGKISKFKYQGSGSYVFKNGCILSCNFTNNKPVGEVIFIDTQRNFWYGHAENDRVLLQKEHVFSYELDKQRGKGVPRHPEPPQEDTASNIARKDTSIALTMKELEQQVFHKSTKTLEDLDFEESDWYREFKIFDEKFKTVMPQVKASGIHSLNPEELRWYRKFLRCLKRLGRWKRPPTFRCRPDCHLLQEFYSDAYKNRCPPMRVFYPTQIINDESQ